MKNYFSLRWLVTTVVLILAVALLWLVTTDHLAIWPIRNTLQYHGLTWWWERTGFPTPGAPGVLRGSVRDAQGQPIAGAWVLAARWDGETHSARSEANGSYTISDIPAGQYRPVAGAPGYDNIQVGDWGWITINVGAETVVDVTLPTQTAATLTPGTNLTLSAADEINCPEPIKAAATRRHITFDNGGKSNQPAAYYTPITTTTTSQLPVLLTIYPGPAAAWECASLPLAAAGYAVVAIGPAYSLELEADIDELERLVNFIRAGQFPGSDSSKLAVLGGSYSSLHVQRMLQRNPNFEAVVLLGPPSDLFDMRRRLEDGSFIPPFGLNQALIALGLPDRVPMRYWRYSGAYHIRPDFPPLAILHSRTDEVVPFQQSELLSANLTQAGVAHETYFFDGASHYLLAEGGDADTLKIYEITLNFLAEHLK